MISQVIIYSDAPFDYPLWTNRQQMAVEIANAGCTVCYVEPPRLRPGDSSVVSIARMRGDAALPALETLRVLTTQVPIPFRYLARLRRRLAVWQARSARSLVSEHSCAIVWGYSPYTAHFASALGLPFVYDIVDDYPQQRHYRDRTSRRAHEQSIRQADLVLATNEALARSAEAVGARRAVALGNGADVELFAAARKKAAGSECGRPLAIYWGALTDTKLDLHLLNDVSSQLPHWDFVMIGRPEEAAEQAASQIHNMTIIGPLPPPELAEVVASATACFAPYRSNSYTTSISPLKVPEAISAGVDVVITEAPRLEGLAGQMWIVHDAAEAVGALERIRAGATRLADIDTRGFSWRAKLMRAAKAMEREGLILGLETDT
jgi:glycosyltransferase involved in cell wall biosynthesis